MSWLQSHDLAVPSYRSASEPNRRPRDNKALFQIRLTARDATADCYTIDRPLTAFHALRDELLQLTQRSSSTTKTRWVRRVLKKNGTTTACSCEAPSPCAFHKIHDALEILPPLPVLGSGFRAFHQQKATLEDNRVALNVWVRSLHKLFSGFSGALLQAKYQRDNCAVLNAYANFLNAKIHFRVLDTSAIRQPLALRAWRAERDQAAVEDLSLLDDEDADDETLHQPSAEQPVALDASQRLPRLEVKRIGLATLQTFLEDFCETILTQYGQDIAELKSPELTEARRWEIGLYVACRIGHSYGAQLILFYYADANVTMEDGTSCLHIAARMGRTSIVTLLLQEGADVNQPNKAGITPLIAACRNGCTEVVKLLLEAGAEVGAASERGTQAIHAAIVSQCAEIVQLLLDAGANVRAATASGLTPLHFAARLGSVALTELLLKHNADPEQQTKSGSDAIMIASTNGHVEICELFQKEMDRKNFLSNSGGKLFHRFKKAAPARNSEAVHPSLQRLRGDSVILLMSPSLARLRNDSVVLMSDSPVDARA